MAETATDAIYRALRSPEPDPDLVHAAVEEIRDLSGQNVIATIGAQIAELRGRDEGGVRRSQRAKSTPKPRESTPKVPGLTPRLPGLMFFSR